MTHIFEIDPEILIDEYELIPPIFSHDDQVMLSIEKKNIPYRILRILEEWHLCNMKIAGFVELLKHFEQNVPKWETCLLKSLMNSDDPNWTYEWN